MPSDKDRAGLTVTLSTAHAQTNHDGGLAETLRRVADQVENGELCGRVYDPTGDQTLGSYDLWYMDGRRASILGNRDEVPNPRNQFGEVREWHEIADDLPGLSEAALKELKGEEIMQSVLAIVINREETTPEQISEYVTGEDGAVGLYEAHIAPAITTCERAIRGEI